MKKWKAILYETPEIMDYLYVSKGRREQLNNPRPIDSILLDKKCFKTAESHFFGAGGWPKGEQFHVEFEEEPRITA
jgi:hypothetical protein